MVHFHWIKTSTLVPNFLEQTGFKQVNALINLGVSLLLKGAFFYFFLFANKDNTQVCFYEKNYFYYHFVQISLGEKLIKGGSGLEKNVKKGAIKI